MSESSDYERINFDRSVTMLRVQGIISIIFGGLGILGALGIIGLMALGASTDWSTVALGALFIYSIITIIFIVLPHLYLIISGVHLLKQPIPSIAKTLTIINLVVGAFYNWIVLIFSIISLVQIEDYQRGYHHKKK